MNILFFLSIATAFDKLCINCKHFEKGLFTPSTFAKCKKFRAVNTDVDHLINGKKKKPTKQMYFCSTARKCSSLCGEEGYGYEDKHDDKIGRDVHIEKEFETDNFDSIF